ncbi:hypothetical protein [Aliidiomarina soli]|uniref:Uncharacterized protein n=1 Tax=Aliidiomarina soli TaxID=1928574 RepID=A0A432WM71_9GAMM|nr:hypothetical protein [Aliidiomarina soli]RUO34854.1 hypothetical protein CWE14_02325 [Aliidiomarina soli]
MDIQVSILLFIVAIPLLTIAVAPTWLVWQLAAKWLPTKLITRPNTMALVSVTLSLVTAYQFKLELEGGAFSAPGLLLGLSLVWSVLLIPVCALAQYLRRLRYKERRM